MTTILKLYNTLKDMAGFNDHPNSSTGSNIDPLPVDQSHGDRENQIRRKEDTILDGQDRRTEGQDNAHVSEDAKTSSSRDRTDLSLHKPSVEARKETRNLGTRPSSAGHGLLTNNPNQHRSLVDESASLRKQLEAIKRNLTQATQQSGELERRLAYEKEGSLRKKMEAENQIRDLQVKNQKLEDELKMLKGTLRGAQEKQSHTAKLLEERTADWKGAQTFLTTGDRYAGAEIMKMVEALNAEIFQGAALISDLLGDETVILEVAEQRKDVKGTQSVKDYLAQFIGPVLVEHLSTKSKQVQVDPLPLQLAVQGVLTSWCVFMVNSFYVGRASDDLREIYRRIWESESQAVAGRWRAMMMGQVKYLDSTIDKDAVIKILFALLRLCGSPMANLNSQETGLCLQQVVSTIIDMWMQLRTAIHEGITTTELRVFHADSNAIYEDAVMNDIYADTEDVQKQGLGKETGHILCAVGMGLQRVAIKRNGDGTTSVQRNIILKARVALASVLFDAVTPIDKKLES